MGMRRSEAALRGPVSAQESHLSNFQGRIPPVLLPLGLLAPPADPFGPFRSGRAFSAVSGSFLARGGVLGGHVAPGTVGHLGWCEDVSLPSFQEAGGRALPSLLRGGG